MLAARGEWVTNEKRLLERAVDGIVGELRAEPSVLAQAVSDVETLFGDAG